MNKTIGGATPAPSTTAPGTAFQDVGARGPVVPDLVSVIVPAFNEVKTIEEIVRRVWAQPFKKEVVVVDDGSRDGTAEAIHRVAQALNAGPREQDTCVRVHVAPINLGKGTAVRIGYALARGGVLAVQDADLELDPADLARLVSRFADPAVEAVYGSRFAKPGFTCTKRQRVANGALTLLTRALFGGTLTDMETCYKLFRRDVVERLNLVSTRFEFEPEITAKVLRLGVTIHEEPIGYVARTNAAGKKIRPWDGVVAAITLVQWRLAPMDKVQRRR